MHLRQSTMTIERQLELFTEYKAKVGTIPERALYIVCSGSNDIVEHFTLADGMSSPEYADMMAHRAIALVEVGMPNCSIDHFFFLVGHAVITIYTYAEVDR